MFRPFRLLPTAAIALLASATVLAGARLPRGPGPEPLTVLVLVATAPAGEPDLLEDLLQTPLEHLGLRPRRLELGDDPPAEVPDDCRGIVLALRRDDRMPAWLWPWLSRQDPRLRVVVFGSLEPLATSAPDRGVFAAWLDRFGLVDDGPPVTDPGRVAVVIRDPERCAFESPAAHATWHVGPRDRDPEHDVWLATVDVAAPQVRRVGVVTGRFGGLALQPFVWRPGAPGARRWHVDPFAFVRAAFDLDGVPVPDPAVRVGCRRFLFDLDARGFDAPCDLEPGATCLDVVIRDVVDRFRLPTTLVVPVGFAADLPPALAALLDRGWVEPALAGRIDAAEELAAVAGCRALVWPRSDPPAAELAARLGAAGIALLGDGTTRRDALHDSLIGVQPRMPAPPAAPLVRAAAVAASVFDAPSDPLPGALRHLDATFAGTGAGRILRPAHLRVRCDVAVSNQARRGALQGLVEERALDPATAPCTFSEYAAAVVALRSIRLQRDAEGWLGTGLAACPTLRFDGESRHVDLERSRGVFGAWRHGDALYVHLGADAVRVVLSEEPPRRPHVARSDARLDDVVLGADAVELVAAGAIGCRIDLVGWGPDAVLRVDVGGRVERREADADGRLTLRLAEPGPVAVRVVAR